MPRHRIEIFLILFAVVLRIIGSLTHLAPNFQILPALLLLIVWNWKLMLPRSVMIGFSTWLISDFIISLVTACSVFSWDQLGVLLYFSISFAILGFMQKLESSARSVLLLSFVSAIAFYVITNTVSYFSLSSLYPRTLWGFWQAQWIGPEGYGPTWCFLKNGVIANLFAGALFLLAQRRFCIYHILAKERFFVRL